MKACTDEAIGAHVAAASMNDTHQVIKTTAGRHPHVKTNYLYNSKKWCKSKFISCVEKCEIETSNIKEYMCDRTPTQRCHLLELSKGFRATPKAST